MLFNYYKIYIFYNFSSFSTQWAYFKVRNIDIYTNMKTILACKFFCLVLLAFHWIQMLHLLTKVKGILFYQFLIFLFYEKHLPQYLQLTIWTFQSTREQLHSWILEVIVTQIKFSQNTVWGLQNWWQTLTGLSFEITWGKSKQEKHSHCIKIFTILF